MRLVLGVNNSQDVVDPKHKVLWKNLKLKVVLLCGSDLNIYNSVLYNPQIVPY